LLKAYKHLTEHNFVTDCSICLYYCCFVLQ